MCVWWQQQQQQRVVAVSVGVGGLLSVVVKAGLCLKGGIVQQVLLCLHSQAKCLLVKECR